MYRVPQDDMAGEGSQALSASKASIHKFIDLGVKYLLPLATFAVGVFTGISTWGGLNMLWGLTAANGSIQAKSGLIGAGLFGGIFGVTGAAFWKLDGGQIMTAVGRALGGYFFGVAVSYVIFAVSPHGGAGDGLIDELVAGIQGL